MFHARIGHFIYLHEMYVYVFVIQKIHENEHHKFHKRKEDNLIES